MTERQAGVIQVALSGSLQNPAFSPDGTAIAFTRFRDGYNTGASDLYVLDLATTVVRPIIADGSANVSEPGSTWSRNGEIIFSSDRDGPDQAIAIKPDGSGRRQLTNIAPAMAWEPSWAPDGISFVYERHDTEARGQIALVQNGQERWITVDSDDCRQPCWSPRGSLIVYQKKTAGGWNLWLHDVASGQARQFTSGDEDTDATFSPDGNSVIYSNGKLVLAPVNGGTAQHFSNAAYMGAPSISPDGKWIACESSTSDPDGGPGTKLLLIPLVAAELPIMTTPSVVPQTTPLTLGQKIKAVMLARGYPWFPDQNVVSVEKMTPSGLPNQLGPDEWRDIKMILGGDGNVIGGPWKCTTHPGVYWTQHPMPGPSGAFIIALGPQAVWTPGEYHGHTVWRQAEDSTIYGTRDPQFTFERQGPPVPHANIGVHHHGTGGDPEQIGRNGAGCQVIEDADNQSAFMESTMQCPRYLADKDGYRLTATVLEAKDLLDVADNPQPAPSPVPQPLTPANTDFAHCLALVLVHEGGNDDDPRDPGGRTSRGILQREWDEWRQSHPGLPSDVWQAPQDQIAAIYKAEYWDLMLCDGLPSGIDYAVFDYGVNSGPSRAAKCLQGILGITADGHIGRNTITAAAAADAKSVIAQVCDQRLAFLHGLSTWGTFGRGWSTRVSDVRRDALAMVGTPIPTPAPPVVSTPPPVVRTPSPQPRPQPPTQPAPHPILENPPVSDPLPLPPPSPSPQPAPALTDAQTALLESIIATTVQKALQKPQVASVLSALLTKLFAAVPQLSVVAYVTLTALQAFGQVGTATGSTATTAGALATSGILGAGALGLLGKLNGFLALIPKP